MRVSQEVSVGCYTVADLCVKTAPSGVGRDQITAVHSPPARLFSNEGIEAIFGSRWDEGASGTTVGTPGM